MNQTHFFSKNNQKKKNYKSIKINKKFDDHKETKKKNKTK